MNLDRSGAKVDQLSPGTIGHSEDDCLCLPSTDERFGEEEIYRWDNEIYEFRGEDGFSRFARLYQGEIVSVLCVRPCGIIEWVYTVKIFRRSGFARELFSVASTVRRGRVRHQPAGRCTTEGNWFGQGVGD